MSRTPGAVTIKKKSDEQRKRPSFGFQLRRTNASNLSVIDSKFTRSSIHIMAFLIRFITIATIAISISACASSRSLGDSVSDLTSNAAIKGVLFSDRDHDYSDVDLTVHEGRLLLTGTMNTDEGRAKLIANAWKADGVDLVIDEIFIAQKTSFGQGFEDTRIDQTLRAKLLADRDVTSGDYKIAVSRAIIYLIGSTRTQAELDEALELASSISGVEKIVHYVNVRSPNNSTTILQQN